MYKGIIINIYLNRISFTLGFQQAVRLRTKYADNYLYKQKLTSRMNKKKRNETKLNGNRKK